jgi:hypothetical protein
LLTKRHLAILRAALRYFDEEMSPHGPRVMRHYFDEPLQEELQTEEIPALRVFLQNCELRFARLDSTGTRLVSRKLWATMEEKNSSTAQQSRQVATVLLPTLK